MNLNQCLLIRPFGELRNPLTIEWRSVILGTWKAYPAPTFCIWPRPDTQEGGGIASSEPRKRPLLGQGFRSRLQRRPEILALFSFSLFELVDRLVSGYLPSSVEEVTSRRAPGRPNRGGKTLKNQS